MRAILDTGVFFRPKLLAAFLSDGPLAVVPTIVVAERRRQLARESRDSDAFVRWVIDGRFIVEPFDTEQVVHMQIHDDATWDRHARDAMIAAHVRDGDVLWTTNPKDFLKLGLRAEQIRGV